MSLWRTACRRASRPTTTLGLGTLPPGHAGSLVRIERDGTPDRTSPAHYYVRVLVCVYGRLHRLHAVCSRHRRTPGAALTPVGTLRWSLGRHASWAQVSVGWRRIPEYLYLYSAKRPPLHASKRQGRQQGCRRSQHRCAQPRPPEWPPLLRCLRGCMSSEDWSILCGACLSGSGPLALGGWASAAATPPHFSTMPQSNDAAKQIAKTRQWTRPGRPEAGCGLATHKGPRRTRCHSRQTHVKRLSALQTFSALRPV